MLGPGSIMSSPRQQSFTHNVAAKIDSIGRCRKGSKDRKQKQRFETAKQRGLRGKLNEAAIREHVEGVERGVPRVPYAVLCPFIALRSESALSKFQSINCVCFAVLVSAVFVDFEGVQ